MLDRLMLVDDDDHVVGYAKKLAAHKRCPHIVGTSQKNNE
jgi:isopentenyldiphosphate isomerase